MTNYTGYDGNHTKVEINPIPGINASNDPQRLIDVLSRMDFRRNGRTAENIGFPRQAAR